MKRYDALMEELSDLLDDSLPDDEIPIPEGTSDAVEEEEDPDESDDG